MRIGILGSGLMGGKLGTFFVKEGGLRERMIRARRQHRGKTEE